jgi:outer membrane lipoprotein-sorting protein
MRYFLCLLPALALAQAPPDARALLMRSGGSTLLADTVRLEGTESDAVVFQSETQTVEDSFKLQRSGARMRLETTSMIWTGLTVADGKYVWTNLSRNHAYTKVPQTNGSTNDPFGRLKFSRDPAMFRDAAVEREEAVKFGGLPVRCYVVRASYGAMPGNPGASDITRTVWISQADDRILRDVWDFTTNPGAPAAGANPGAPASGANPGAPALSANPGAPRRQPGRSRAQC